MTPLSAFHTFAAACNGGSFLGLPTWYKYLPCANGSVPQFTDISDTWLILAAVIEILLRVAGLVAVFLVIFGGIQLMTSQGEPDKVAKARTAITNALIGLAIAIVAATAVNFIATRIQGS